VELRLWVSLTELTVIGGLGVTLMVWLVHAALRERRKKRAIERFLASAGPSRQAVTVDEMVAPVEAEGLPVTGR